MSLCSHAQSPSKEQVNEWQWCGWGGGGFYWSAVFHPTQDGVIYMGGDMCGVYKTVDHGKNWRMSNIGLVHYGVFSLAVDRKSPQTVYAGTPGGLHKSTDAGEHWRLLPLTGPKDLRITSERAHSVRSIAVDPTNSNIVYAGSPGGKIYKSTDGAETWKVAYEPKVDTDDVGVLRVQFGKVNNGADGGMFLNNPVPAAIKAEDCVGIGFSIKGDGTLQQNACVILVTSNGSYRSKNIGDLFKNREWQDVVLKAQDFSIDPDFAKKNPDKVATLPAAPDLATVKQLKVTASGIQPKEMSVIRIKRIFLALTHTPDGKTATAAAPILHTVREFTKDKKVGVYGNVRTDDPALGGVFTVAVSEKNPAMVLAATQNAGILLSEDGGQNWKALATPSKASSVAIVATDANVLYGTFFADGLMKSTDKGKTWSACTEGINPEHVFIDVAINPANAQEVYAIAENKASWFSRVYSSKDGGKTWTANDKIAPDYEANPTKNDGAGTPATVSMSRLTNIAINPSNPKELFLSANWRPCISQDGGVTWAESDHGADITCFNDIRFSKGRVYACAHDEGAFVSDNDGKTWRQLWPLKFSPDLTGHYVQLAITDNNGKDRIISTCSPWNTGLPSRIVISEDSGATFKLTLNGLPDYRPMNNTMWGTSYIRGLTVDPNNPKVVYAGMDGDPAPGKMGGGIFKSADGGYSWKQLANQPGSRRGFSGLAVDPTDSKRLFWGACGTGAGFYVSNDGGESWKSTAPGWVFSILVTPKGEVYFCGATGVWRSTDHGVSWKNIHAAMPKWAAFTGLEVDPRDPKTIWASVAGAGEAVSGGVFKTTDGGATWTEITGNLPYHGPMVLRFNPATNELWAAGKCLFKIKQ